MSSLDAQIAVMEERVLNAATLEASAKFHEQLDALRTRRDRQRLPADDRADAYKRGYDSGYHAGQRLAATRTPEPPDWEAAMVAGLIEDADRDRRLVAEWDGRAEPPDSGDPDCRHQNENGLLCLRRRHDDLRHEFQRRIGDRSGSPAPEGGE